MVACLFGCLSVWLLVCLVACVRWASWFLCVYLLSVLDCWFVWVYLFIEWCECIRLLVSMSAIACWFLWVYLFRWFRYVYLFVCLYKGIYWSVQVYSIDGCKNVFFLFIWMYLLICASTFVCFCLFLCFSSDFSFYSLMTVMTVKIFCF